MDGDCLAITSWPCHPDPLTERFFFMRGSECPHCGSGWATKKGEGRRLCRSCGRSFRASIGTVMSSAKLPRAKFRAMANLMFNDVKLEAICDVVGISTRTACVWRMKSMPRHRDPERRVPVGENLVRQGLGAGQRGNRSPLPVGQEAEGRVEEPGRHRLIRFLDSPDEVYKSVAKESHPILRP